MILFLCLATYALVGYAVFKVCVRDGAVKLNAFFFFSLGFVYYWLTPHFLAYLMQAAVPEELEIVFERFFSIPDSASIVFIGGTFVFYSLFFWGYQRKARKRWNSAPVPVVRSSKRAVAFWSVAAGAAVLLATLMAMPVREYFFVGYDAALFENYQDGVVQDALPRGTFIASTSILFALGFMRAVVKHGHHMSLKKILLDPFMLVYYVFAVLALSMGGRLYFVTNVVTIVVFVAVVLRVQVRIRGLVLLGAVSAGGAGLWGVLRAGGEFSVANLFMNLAQEPMLTSISAFSFLAAGNVPVINFPIFLMSDFVNLLPSSLFPGKVAYLLDPRENGFDFAMPLGGLHAFVSLMINFGLLGAAFVFYMIGALVGRYEYWRRPQAAVIYCLTCACLTFTFNRDPFSVSVVKNIFENAFLIPLILYSIQKGFFR